MTALLSAPAELRELLGIPFTDDQLAAACAPLAPGLVVAGAGSGKTSVMAARVVWLVATGQVRPEQVLGLTFTNKAAGELGARLRMALAAVATGPRPDLVGAAVQGQASPDVVDDPGEPVVSTYHSYAGRLVTEHGLRLGIEPRSRLLADATRFQLAGRVLRRHRGRVQHLTAPLGDVIGQLVALDGELSEHLVTPEALQQWDAGWRQTLGRALAEHEAQPKTKTHCDSLRAMLLASERRSELVTLVLAYRAAKRELDALDFGDQVALAAQLAEQVPEVGAAERLQARVVLLDEYQDTSVAQRRMLAGIFGHGHPVTAVGDPCQAIYGWRGASVSNLDGFPEHFPNVDDSPATSYALAVNMRSGGRLLALANGVAASLRARHRVVLLESPPAKAELGEVVVALHPSWQQECAWVAAQIRAAVGGGTPAAQCAVLVRARSDFGDLHAALVAAGLPVEVVGLGGLLALPEVADVVAVLEVLDDATANAPLVRLLTGPRWRLGPRDLAVLGRRARELLRLDSGPAARGGEPADALEQAVTGVDPADTVALADALNRPGEQGWSPEALTRVQALDAELRLLRASREEPLLDLVHRVVDVTGLGIELAASPEAVAARRRESLLAFLDVVADFSDAEGRSSLSSFLAYLRAAQTYDRGLDATSPSGSQAVQLLTAHRAKGLEWDVVACPDLTASVFPVTTMRGAWTTHGEVLPGALRGDAPDQPTLGGCDKAELKAYGAEARAHLERDERRLGYVAFTRARHTLIGSAHWWGPTQKKPRGPSPFLSELHAHALAGGGRVEVWTEPPADARNPLLAEPVGFVWPAPFEAGRLQRRQQAADQVSAALAARVAGAPVGDGPGGTTTYEREMLDRLDREARLLLEEERQVRRGVREVALPHELTASQLLRLQADPDGLARELARPLPRRPVPAARLGICFHAWLEAHFAAGFEQRPLLDPDELPGAGDADSGDPDDGDLRRLQEAFLASPWASRRPHAVEAPFVLPLAGRVIRGQIDAVYEVPTDVPAEVTGEATGEAAIRWEVVDWKTGAGGSDPLQLAVYRLAWARLADVPLEAVAASFCYVADGRTERYAAKDLPGPDELSALLTGRVLAEQQTLL